MKKRIAPIKEARTDRQLRTLREQAAKFKRLYEHSLNESEKYRSRFESFTKLVRPVRDYVIRPKESSNTSEAVAFAVMSDTHFEETVRLEETNGLNEYSLDIAKKRCDEFFAKVVRLIRKERQDVVIREMVLCVIGDLITNDIHPEFSETCSLLPMDAARYAQKLITSGIKHLLEHAELDKLTVVCKSGNHGRTTKEVHISTEEGHSIESLIYHAMAASFENDPRVQFVIETGYFTYLDVYGYTVRVHHGHAIRSLGGVGGIYPALLRKIHQWNLSKRADHEIMGHFHQYIPARRFTVNGSLIGYNAFAIRIGAEYEPPQQAFFLLDKKRGVTVRIPILFSV